MTQAVLLWFIMQPLSECWLDCCAVTAIHSGHLGTHLLYETAVASTSVLQAACMQRAQGTGEEVSACSILPLV